MEKSIKHLLFLFVLAFAFSMHAQEKNVTGKVTDASGTPLPGVNVLVQGTTTGTQTDFDGNYSLATATGSILSFSYLGMKGQTVTVGNNTTINIIMEEDAAQLGEVVVVGYGTQKKTNVTSAVASVDSEELNQSSVANISNALVGRLPGLVATQRSGQPGANGSQLLIRGVSTTGNSAPLIIVDGVQREFRQLDPNTIESITILKDASAAAVYGVRGANGVILITTKRGKIGKPVINYSTEITVTKPTQLPNYLGSYDYARLFNEAKRNEGKAELYSEDDLEKFRSGSDPLNFPDTDYYAEGLRSSALLQQHSVNISGGSERVKYFVSGGATTENGLIESILFRRQNVRANLDFQITDDFKISLDVSGRQEERTSPTTGVGSLFSGLSRLAPVGTAYYPNGLPGVGVPGGNPIEAARSGGTSIGKRTVLLGNVNLEYKIPRIDGLTLKAYMAIDRMHSVRKTITKQFTIYQFDQNTGEYNPQTGGSSRIFQSYFNGPAPSNSGVPDPTTTYNATLNYDRTFGEKHLVTGLLGVEKAIHKSNSFNANRQNLISDALPELNFADAETAQNGGSSFNAARLGYLARVTYAFDTKYLLEASFRYDASENFAKENRWGFFPSFSAGWRISKEKFMDDVAFIDEMKIRGSWGRLGNDRIAQFQFLDAFNFSGSYIVGGNAVQTIRPGVIPNPDVTWETATIRNIGFDLEVMERKLGIEFDYFTKTTEDILAAPTRIVPGFVGASLPNENFGVVNNKGFEASLSYRNQIGLFDYWVKGNYTYSKNEIVEIGEPETVTDNLRVTGRSIGSRFGLVADGLFQSQAEIDAHADQSGFGALAPGDIRYKDISGDGVIDNDDRDFIGVTANPNAIFGLSFGGTYNNGLDFSVQFQGAHDFNVYLSEEAAFPFFNGGKVLEQHLDSWRPDNTDAEFPRILTEDTNNRLVSSFWLKNASYVRLKNIEVGYTFPKDILSKLKIDNLRLYLSGLNLVTFSGIENFDPEAPSGRGAFYPQTQAYTLGLNISL